jgi:hypothetical protein
MTVKRCGNDNDSENKCQSTTNPKWNTLGLNPAPLGEEHRQFFNVKPTGTYSDQWQNNSFKNRLISLYFKRGNRISLPWLLGATDISGVPSRIQIPSGRNY